VRVECPVCGEDDHDQPNVMCIGAQMGLEMALGYRRHDGILEPGVRSPVESFLGAGKPAGQSPVAEGSDPQGWPTQVAYPSDKTRGAVTNTPPESSSDQPVVNARGVASATGPGEAT
jgi:hypothetical protein